MQIPLGVSSIFDEKAFLSALEWWQLAGVDEAIVEEPVNWLASATPQVEMAGATSAPLAAEVSLEKPIEPLPATLPEFRQWLLKTEALPETIPLSARIAFSTPEQADLVIMVDMPESEDRQSGRFMSGPAGALLNAMLRAIGRARDDVALIPLLPGRTPTGRPAEAALNRWGEIGRHHLALMGAKRVLLMGESVNRAIMGASFIEMRLRLRAVNQDQAHMQAVATFDPRFLLRQPLRKRDAWQDVLMFAKDV